MEQQKYDIYILSYGLNPYRDLSIATLECLRTASHVYIIRSNPNLSSFLDSDNITYTDITHLYSSGSDWNEIYNTISEYIIKEAIANKGICYLTYGNPMLFDKPVRLIQEKAYKAGLSVLILPALSFIDIIFSYLGISIDQTGLQVYDANEIIRNNNYLKTDSHTLLVQIGAFGDHRPNENSFKSSEQFTPLINYLRKFYPPDHEIVVCDSDATGLNPVFCKIPLCWFQLLSRAVNYSTTLYLPPKK